MRAMLLGAGYGTRLRPLTSLLPKPLVPVGLRPLLEWHLEAFAALGIESVALNASHLAERIERDLADRANGMPRVELLREEAPLGTGGGLLGARELLAAEDSFLVVNADTFHAIDLRSVLAAHREAEADATLVVRRAAPGEPQDELLFDREGRLTGIADRGGARDGWRFSGVHVLSPRVFEHLSSPGSLVAGYLGLLREGATVIGHDCDNPLWFDVGTPAGYLDANLAAAWLGTASAEPPRGLPTVEPALVAASAELGADCTIGPGAVIGEGAVIGPGCRVVDSVVWPGTAVPAGSRLSRRIVHPGGILTVPDAGEPRAAIYR